MKIQWDKHFSAREQQLLLLTLENRIGDLSRIKQKANLLSTISKIQQH